VTEGELMKRINEKKEWKGFVRWIKVWQVNDILNEARTEFYEIMNSSSKGYGDLEEAIVKWFGARERGHE
jgi:hypothetical protein